MSQSRITTKRSFLAACAASVCAASLCLPAAAQDASKYPEREVTMIINYGAGGNTDVAARAIGNAMEGLLNKPVVPNNRSGAQGTLGVSSLAKQRADGYTLGIVTFSTIAITPHLMNVDYTVDNFDFIAGVARYRYGVAVRADSPYKTVQDLIDAARKDKGVFFGAPSAPNNIAMFELGRKSGGKFEQVSYKSGAETVSALLGGHVDVIVQNPSDIVPHVKAGKMRLLASASPMRWKELPDVPTLKEQGFDVEIDSWIGLAFPKGTPAAIRERMEKVAMTAAASAQLAPILETAGVDPAALTGAEYRSKLIEGRDAMAIAIKAANLPRMN
ncbi:tripartite tricarboxylate transporter substrate binding protein [Pantoea sp. 18069]|uniref:Bug family tripartite tricarboxylate transporter substrate binding protein n=1 Tax=Pantoea sp. 18069 TaxID=2681415 RepID=UPI001358391A|nr:tripartite tricarboxylate transporter substrate binding protein [Pantoea sp. 18069]